MVSNGEGLELARQWVGRTDFSDLLVVASTGDFTKPFPPSVFAEALTDEYPHLTAAEREVILARLLDSSSSETRARLGSLLLPLASSFADWSLKGLILSAGDIELDNRRDVLYRRFVLELLFEVKSAAEGGRLSDPAEATAMLAADRARMVRSLAAAELLREIARFSDSPRLVAAARRAAREVLERL